MTAAPTQLDRIEAILEKDGEIDNFRAIHERISLRLGARIFDLKARGWDFEVHTDQHKNTHYRVTAQAGGEDTHDECMTHVKHSANGCAWPKCKSKSRIELLVDPSPEFVLGIGLCVEHKEFINTLFFLMQLQVSKSKRTGAERRIGDGG